MGTSDRPGEPSAEPDCDVSIVIPNWNGGEVLTECVDSILRQTVGVEYELILVDNGSTDESREMVASYAANNPHVTAILNDDNLYFARACNQGYETSRGRYLLVANNDIVLRDDAVSELVRYAERHPRVGVVTPRFVGTDGQPQELFRRLPNAAYVLAHYHRLGRAVDRVLLGRWLQRRYLYRDRAFVEVETIQQPGASFTLLRRDLVEHLGFLFDERYPLLFNDVDLARRIRASSAISVVVPDIRVVHLGGVSSAKMAAATYQRLQFDALFTYFQEHHPVQVWLLRCAWPSHWWAFRRRR